MVRQHIRLTRRLAQKRSLPVQESYRRHNIFRRGCISDDKWSSSDILAFISYIRYIVIILSRHMTYKIVTRLIMWSRHVYPTNIFNKEVYLSHNYKFTKNYTLQCNNHWEQILTSSNEHGHHNSMVN